MTRQVYALLGRKDQPTDAVEEYCHYLAAALQPHEIQMNIRRVPWEIHGWREALRGLKLQAANWRGTWVLVQYTALAWSARGFPFRFLRALRILRSAGARVGIVFHDVTPYSSPRWIDQLRYHAQRYTMRHALLLSDLAIFTVPLYKLTWLRFTPANAVYIDPGSISERNEAADGPSPLMSRCHFVPVGPNLPIPKQWQSPHPANEIPTIGIFSITGGEQGVREVVAILGAIRFAMEKFGKIRLLVFGRHAELREETLRQGLRNAPVELSVEGVLEDHQIIERLRSSDILLFVRGGISTRRSSAIAGIACGIPMIAYVGLETSWPLQDAGVMLVSPSDPQELNAALLRLLSDAEFLQGLSKSNEVVYQEHFAWDTIAARFAGLLKSH